MKYIYSEEIPFFSKIWTLVAFSKKSRSENMLPQTKYILSQFLSIHVQFYSFSLLAQNCLLFNGHQDLQSSPCNTSLINEPYMVPHIAISGSAFSFTCVSQCLGISIFASYYFLLSLPLSSIFLTPWVASSTIIFDSSSKSEDCQQMMYKRHMLIYGLKNRLSFLEQQTEKNSMSDIE